MPKPLASNDLLSLEQYAKRRAGFRAEVMAHKQLRTVHIGPHATWLFEDRLTIQYQVQEMLRIERIFEPAGIQDELDAYNPLIPTGSNWKATFLIEFSEVAARRDALARMRGIEDRCWVQVGAAARVYALADEDMPRSNDDKTSAVHFLRFELSAPMVVAAQAGQAIHMGIDHDAYRHQVGPLTEIQRAALLEDLTS